jgi:DNA-binding CsgD family transcriptional regulator
MMPTTQTEHGLSRRRIARLQTRYKLTHREIEVCSLLIARRTNREIADVMGISEHTARHHTENVLRKLGVRSRIDVSRLVAVEISDHR